MAKRIMVLGGYGNLGYNIADLLLKETKNVVITIAGKNENYASKTAQKLSNKYYTERLQARRVDASIPASLISAFNEVDMVVNAASTLDYNQHIIEAAIDANIDYLDTHISLDSKSKILKSFESDIIKNKLCFITDGGAHPGMPAAMVRSVASQFDEVYNADVIASVQHNWNTIKFSPSTVVDMVSSFKKFKCIAYRDGAWRPLKWNEFIKLDLGIYKIQKTCSPLYLEEMELLPGEFPTLERTGFFYTGFNWFVDFIIIPVANTSQNLFGRTYNDILGKFLLWGLRQFTDPPYSSVLELTATGRIDGETKVFRLKLSHQNLYTFAAVPVVSCLLQYLDLKVRRTGIWYQGLFVEPNRFFKDIDRLGVKVEQDFMFTKMKQNERVKV